MFSQIARIAVPLPTGLRAEMGEMSLMCLFSGHKIYGTRQGASRQPCRAMLKAQHETCTLLKAKDRNMTERQDPIIVSVQALTASNACRGKGLDVGYHL